MQGQEMRNIALLSPDDVLDRGLEKMKRNYESCS
jgi:hypothetical protein